MFHYRWLLQKQFNNSIFSSLRLLYATMANEAQLTPMMAQYRRIKERTAQGWLCCSFRLGDYYEMFFEDAQEGAQLLKWRDQRGVVPMCGIPFHALNRTSSRCSKPAAKWPSAIRSKRPARDNW